MKDLSNKKVLFIICGGISAYKSLETIRMFRKNNAEIKTILTKSAKEFVTPLSVASLSQGKVYDDLFSLENETEMDHISLSRWADVIIVAPATANTISKLSQGNSDDLASTVILASNKQVFLVPAMNVRMWEHKATQKNLNTLIDYGYKFIGPEDGEMACGEYGKGKMSSPRQILSFLVRFFKKKDLLKSKKIKAIVTTGPTKEYIDPVRFISNESSGKQGYEIALELKRLGIKTTLISGPTKLKYDSEIAVKRVVTAKQMLEAVKKKLPTHIAVCAAAVSDFKPLTLERNKIKKNQISEIKIEKNPDILSFLGKNNRFKPKLLVGFSAETENLVKNSKIKMQDKLCDIMIANDVSKKDRGFHSDSNEVLIIDKSGKIEKVKKNSKRFIASIVAKKIIDTFLTNEKNLN